MSYRMPWNQEAWLRWHDVPPLGAKVQGTDFIAAKAPLSTIYETQLEVSNSPRTIFAFRTHLFPLFSSLGCTEARRPTQSSRGYYRCLSIPPDLSRFSEDSVVLVGKLPYLLSYSHLNPPFINIAYRLKSLAPPTLRREWCRRYF
jgi:hypothetical protein